MRYTLDTNSISAILRKEAIKQRVEYSVYAGDTININAISYYEVTRGLLYKDSKDQLKDFIKLCRDHLNIELMNNISIFDKAAEIYAGLRGKKLGDCDILIASIACIGRFTLITDDGDFGYIKEIIKDLNIDNWLI